MRTLDYTPETLTKVVYQLSTAESEYQRAKDNYEILEEQQKDLLASLCHQVASNGDVSVSKSEILARGMPEWQAFRKGLFEAQKVCGEKKVRYNHLVRVMDCIISSMAYNRELLKKGLSGEGGK